MAPFIAESVLYQLIDAKGFLESLVRDIIWLDTNHEAAARRKIVAALSAIDRASNSVRLDLKVTS
jgi:hypothetical protein